MIQAKRVFVQCRDWFIGISDFELCNRVSLSIRVVEQWKNLSVITEDKIAVCEKTAGLRCGKFSHLNSACSKVLVPIKIFQFQDMLNENRFLGTIRGHSKQPITRVLLCAWLPEFVFVIFSHVNVKVHKWCFHLFRFCVRMKIKGCFPIKRFFI
jgi:hypothetical protein